MRADDCAITSFVQKCPSVPTYLFLQNTLEDMASLNFPSMYLSFKNVLIVNKKQELQD